LAVRPDAADWTPLAVKGETTTFYAGGAEIELYRTETDSYRRNLASAVPAVWVALHETDGDPPYTIASVTADPAEGEGLSEAGLGVIERLPRSSPSTISSAFLRSASATRPIRERSRDTIRGLENGDER